MQGITPGKCVIWALLLCWPWVVRYAASNSPEMIVKGYVGSTSVWMPLIADVVLVAGGAFALHARKRQMGVPEPVKTMTRTPRHHFALRDRVERKSSRSNV